MKEKSDIAVLGGGNAGQTHAADLALAGYKVRLYELPEFAPKSLGKAMETGEIELGGTQSNPKGFKRTGIAKIDMVTTDMSEALKGASIVIVAVPAFAQEAFFEKMIPYLEDGQIISIHTDNFGSLILRKMMREKKCDAKVIIGGWHSQPYGTRLTEPGKVLCDIREANQIYDTLPSKDSDTFIKAVRNLPIFDGVSDFIRADTVIGVGIENANPVVHVPGSILNVGAMEVSETEGLFNIPKGQWSLYTHGMSPSVSRAQAAFYHEELKIMNALGLKVTHEYPDKQFFSKVSIMAPEVFIPFGIASLNPLNWRVNGPTSVSHRYFTEDIPIGCVVRYSLAKAINVEVPIIKGMIDLGSIICERDFLKEGRTLEKIGLGGLRREQIIKYVREGNI